MDEGLDAVEQTESARAERDAALVALGIDAATIVWPKLEADATDARAKTVESLACAPMLDDAAWQLLMPLLPAEAPQASAMTNREFLDAVLAAMQRGGAWTSRATPTAEIEPVRRRFGRWAHAGVFEVLAEGLPDLALAADHKRLLALAGRRAASLRARSAGRH